jgi:glycosyltransferase involved in cell wall biosynthesis
MGHAVLDAARGDVLGVSWFCRREGDFTMGASSGEDGGAAGSVDLPRRPRILMVSGEAPPLRGGVGDSTHWLLRELAALRPGWRWLWLSRRPRWRSAPIERLGPITLLRPAFGWGEASTRLSEAVARLCHANVVHVQDEEYSYAHTAAACRIAAAARAPIVSTLHEFHVDGLGVAHTAELARRSDVVVANDRRTAERCREHAGRAPDRVLWSVSTIRPPDPSVEIRRQAGLIATFGFINGLKGLDLVHGGLSHLHACRPDLRWNIIGPFEPATKPEHAELAARLTGDWLSFTGGLPEADVRSRLAEARMMVLPFRDGASTRRGTLQVAWSFGLPVVTTPPQVEEPSIVDGWNCLLVREATPEAWARAIRRVLDDPALEARLREGSLATAREFAVGRQAAYYVEIYESLIRRAAPAGSPPKERRR